MANDLLNQFRSGSQPKVVAGPSPVAYEAYKLSHDRQYRLKVRPALRAWERINYSYLHRIVEDGIYGTEIGLIFSFAVILIKGRNLTPIAEAIDRETCELVQQFDASRWPAPTDPKAPFIDKIEIHVQTKVQASDELLASIEVKKRTNPE